MVQENCIEKPKIIIVCGPTGSGKTGLAVNISLKFGGEVVSADSVSIYKGLDIGSAKPTEVEKKGVPHYMIDVVEPNAEFSVSEYENAALPIVYNIISSGKIPVICGGTGFYINSILYEMSYGKTAGDRSVREKYETLAKERGNAYVYDILKRTDPETAEVLHPNDLTRVVRALEIYELSGIKKSAIKDDRIPRFDAYIIMTDIKRDVLYRRIDSRVDKMIAEGLENEVVGLLKQGITTKNQCMQGIGYKEVAESVEKGEPLPIELIKMRSRRYAKRQITFFKRYDGAKRVDPTNGDSVREVFDDIEKFINKRTEN